jgi:hypothetical protein
MYLCKRRRVSEVWAYPSRAHDPTRTYTCKAARRASSQSIVKRTHQDGIIHLQVLSIPLAPQVDQAVKCSVRFFVKLDRNGKGRFVIVWQVRKMLRVHGTGHEIGTVVQTVAPMSGIGMCAHTLQPREWIANNHHGQYLVLDNVFHTLCGVAVFGIRQPMLTPRYLPDTGQSQVHIVPQVRIE